jgi:TRAP-type C4-dicarboxylate transport system substrate-binding protein
MLDIRVAPLVAGVLMNDAAWNRLSTEDRARMIDIARATEQRLFTDARNLDARHIAEMQASGLKVVALDRAAAAEFRATADRLTATQRGTVIPPDIYDRAVRERDAYRKSNEALPRTVEHAGPR